MVTKSKSNHFWYPHDSIFSLLASSFFLWSSFVHPHYLTLVKTSSLRFLLRLPRQVVPPQRGPVFTVSHVNIKKSAPQPTQNNKTSTTYLPKIPLERHPLPQHRRRVRLHHVPTAPGNLLLQLAGPPGHIVEPPLELARLQPVLRRAGRLLPQQGLGALEPCAFACVYIYVKSSAPNRPISNRQPTKSNNHTRDPPP